ncbi:archaetidylserine decarboxylase [Metallibacterium sp.]|uniref:archaetidylserine decarboxylase n=1 Tax=Metallibacterium sp. TaxID=2940281 RepID=UPI0026110B20|nr:archaetidylserine decarboxylase [Metallibacterium sp.]
MRFSVAVSHMLPQHALSALVRVATRWRWRPWKNWLIQRVVRGYGVDLAEAESADVASYAHFDAFFTRALKPGVRPLDADPRSLLCPADGRISQAGAIRNGRIVQAKGRDYSVAELLGDAAATQRYAEGSFVNVYLSPRDYHRVHMPCAGRLVETLHIPGRLFSVAPAAVAGVDRLFARNERLVCHFESEHGLFVVIMVGALLVSGISTIWAGHAIPPYAHAPQRVRHAGPQLEAGAEMARFHMGSTVIVLLPAGAVSLRANLVPELAVRMGQRLGTLSSPAN